jgi:hypothetical protein
MQGGNPSSFLAIKNELVMLGPAIIHRQLYADGCCLTIDIFSSYL